MNESIRKVIKDSNIDEESFMTTHNKIKEFREKRERSGREAPGYRISAPFRSRSKKEMD